MVEFISSHCLVMGNFALVVHKAESPFIKLEQRFIHSFLLLPFHDGNSRQLWNYAILSILHCVMGSALVQESEGNLISVFSVTSYATLGDSLLSGP